MQITDPIADMLTRIRNAGSAKHESVDVPASKMKKAIAEILLNEGYIKNFQMIDDGTQGIIRITLKYLPGKEKAIQGLRRVSKPGLRVYAGADELPRVLKGLGIAIISTSKGVMVDEHNHVTVKGPKGSIERTLVPQMKIDITDGVIHVSRPDDTKENRSLHGLTRTLIDNMVVGVTHGFEKKLEINGVGYRAQKEGKNLVMNLGYSHQVIMSENEDIQIDVPDANHIVIKGIDKQKVGQFAAEVRGKRPPEPYKGKGIKYDYETIRRKEGKTGAK